MAPRRWVLARVATLRRPPTARAWARPLPRRCLPLQAFSRKVEPVAHLATVAERRDEGDGEDAGASDRGRGVMEAKATPLAPAAAEPPVPPQVDDSGRIDPRVWPIAASALMMGSAIGVVMPALPLFAKDIGISPAGFGQVVSIMGITRLFFNVPAAMAAERFGRRPLLVGGPVLTAVGMGLTGTAHSMGELLSYRFITAAGGSFQMSGAQLYLTDISTPANRARTMAPLMASFSAGTAVGPAVGGYLAENFGLATPFYLVGGVIGAVSALNYFTLPETHTRLEPAYSGKQLDQGAAGKAPREGAAAGEKSQGEQQQQAKGISSAWADVLRSRDLGAAVLLHSSYWVTTAACQFTLLPILASESFGMGAGDLGFIYAMMSVINVLGSQPAAWVSDNIGRKTSIVTGGALYAAAAAMLPWATDTSMLYGIVGLYGVGSTILGTAPSAYVADVADERSRAAALAVQRSGGDLGLLVGATLGGSIAVTYGVPAAMMSAAAVMAMSTAGFGIIARAPAKAAEALKEARDRKA
mmetsp:Transcript_23240/g.72585  ORF Transcript_23240/g.72585 Transcript_23240/m.72585 type:complete len:528 (+) Transcript_23240:14-1597(+)